MNNNALRYGIHNSAKLAPVFPQLLFCPLEVFDIRIRSVPPDCCPTRHETARRGTETNDIFRRSFAGVLRSPPGSPAVKSADHLSNNFPMSSG